MKKYLLFLILIVILSSWSFQDGNWRPLFNGKDLSGWQQVGPGKFVVEDGLLKTIDGMGMILYPAEKFSNVIIRVVFKVKDNDCNSGVFIRLPEKPINEWAAVNTGYEVQIDNGTRHVGGEWNTMEITLDGQRTIVNLNGEKVTDFTEGDAVPPKTRDFEPERGPRPEWGYIGLQNHDSLSTVYFKEVTVKPLK